MAFAPRRNISLSQHGDMAHLVVQDSGPGIPRERHSKIFERFERANANKNVGGLGLGLFIVKTIIEAHEGTINIESDKGQGTKFIIKLPLNPKFEH
jgi:signal transduction histidine kinase